MDPVIPFGDPRGNGCLPGAGDSILGGSPGNAAALPGGVAASFTSATYEDTNNDGLIQLECIAERDFAVLVGTPTVVVIDVDGNWSSPDVIDVNAVFRVEVDPGFTPVQVVQGFSASTGGTFSGSAASPPQPAIEAGNTLRVSGNIDFLGPSGFRIDTEFVASIDGQVIPTIPVPTFGRWQGHAAVGLGLLLLAVWALRRRSLQGSL